MNPKKAALLGGLFVVPFLVANAIVAKRIEPFFSFIRPGPDTSAFEMVLLAVVLLCLPLGAFIAVRPMLERRDGRRRFLVANGLIAAILLLAFGIISTQLGAELYRCEVLQIANCD